MQEGDHYLAVCRYAERDALRANLVERADDWPWSSLGQRVHQRAGPQLAAGPIAWPSGWVRHVNAAQSEAELVALRRAVQRGSPFGEEDWQQETAKRLGLESTLRPRGRPRKVAEAE